MCHLPEVAAPKICSNKLLGKRKNEIAELAAQ